MHFFGNTSCPRRTEVLVESPAPTVRTLPDCHSSGSVEPFARRQEFSWQLLRGEMMATTELSADKDSSSARSTTELSKQIANRKVVTMGRKNGVPESGLAENLSSALQAADSEFGQILQEVEQISRLLKSGHPDTQTMRVATHPAVWGAVKQALLDRELRCLALTDDLTCLYNRRGFFAAATQQLRLAQRNGQNLLLLFCDVDNLKKINDTYGHQEGDLALIRTADALEQSFRGSDILSRLGGDEFVVLASEASNQTQDIILRRLEKNLKKSSGAELRYGLSLCVGVARFDPKRAVTLGELMVQADRAMYEKKRRTQKVV
ncbi:MAG TPA: GGDEF domain-containing protein [Candidatus Acidoferrum sp.]|nr:GGDEF domain-containing protein [Candidatus Acidoferrum sp.]